MTPTKCLVLTSWDIRALITLSDIAIELIGALTHACAGQAALSEWATGRGPAAESAAGGILGQGEEAKRNPPHAPASPSVVGGTSGRVEESSISSREGR